MTHIIPPKQFLRGYTHDHTFEPGSASDLDRVVQVLILDMLTWINNMHHSFKFQTKTTSNSDVVKHCSYDNWAT